MVTRVDNSVAMNRHHAEIDRMLRNLDRAEAFLGTLALAGLIDETINDAAADTYLLTEHRIECHLDQIDHLLAEHGEISPTLADWDELSERDRALIVADYEFDLIRGTWEFNAWGPVIDQVRPGLNAMTRH